MSLSDLRPNLTGSYLAGLQGRRQRDDLTLDLGRLTEERRRSLAAEHLARQQLEEQRRSALSMEADRGVKTGLLGREQGERERSARATEGLAGKRLDLDKYSAEQTALQRILAQQEEERQARVREALSLRQQGWTEEQGRREQEMKQRADQEAERQARAREVMEGRRISEVERQNLRTEALDRLKLEEAKRQSLSGESLAQRQHELRMREVEDARRQAMVLEAYRQKQLEEQRRASQAQEGLSRDEFGLKTREQAERERSQQIRDRLAAALQTAEIANKEKQFALLTRQQGEAERAARVEEAAKREALQLQDLASRRLSATELGKARITSGTDRYLAELASKNSAAARKAESDRLAAAQQMELHKQNVARNNSVMTLAGLMGFPGGSGQPVVGPASPVQPAMTPQPATSAPDLRGQIFGGAAPTMRTFPLGGATPPAKKSPLTIESILKGIDTNKLTADQTFDLQKMAFDTILKNYAEAEKAKRKPSGRSREEQAALDRLYYQAQLDATRDRNRATRERSSTNLAAERAEGAARRRSLEAERRSLNAALARMVTQTRFGGDKSWVHPDYATTKERLAEVDRELRSAPSSSPSTGSATDQLTPQDRKTIAQMSNDQLYVILNDPESSPVQVQSARQTLRERGVVSLR